MNEKALNTLEYNKIIDMLCARAVSPMGKVVACELKPVFDLDEITVWQKETTEAVSFVLKKGSIPLGGIKDIRPSLKRSEVGGVLSIDELLHVGDFIYVCRKIINYSKSEGKRDVFELLDPQFELVKPVPELEKEISRCIVNEQEIADGASARLSEIRRSIKISNDRIKEQLNAIIHSQTYKNMLQDSVITIRNGRFCVPVKQEYRNSFSGMIHDQSSTGATLFMEPMSVVALNNKIKELTAEEKTEIEAVLRKLSAMTAEFAELMYANIEILTHLDFVFAKAELSLSMFGCEPVFNTKGKINIIKGRHPLLSSESVVPTNIYLGDKFTTLLITGPNTGGKTVCLKTIGLFTLMGQAGLHIPAQEHSELAVFDNVFADIGDEQSIEQSLSTFSGHMSNIVKILDEVTDYSLVLLDELGAGTDPTEGAAIATAIIEYLHGRKIRTAVTTHYSELKVYALATDGVENAACEFDVETLRPTYKLLIGIPGKSNAFAISRRLGLPEHVIDSAKELLSQENERFEDIITDLEIGKKTVVLEKERAEQFRREAEKLKLDYEQQKDRLQQQRDKLLLEAKNEARNIVEQAKAESDAILKDMQKMKAENISFKELEEKRQALRNKANELDAGISEIIKPKKVLKPAPASLKVGDRVYIHTLMQSGTVLSASDSNGEVSVQSGIMKVKVNISDVSLDETKEEKPKHKQNYSAAASSGKSLTISPKIDLRGNMVDEALEKVDKYLDDAYLSGLGKVEIIHGKGTGALRSAIQSHLKTHPYVKSYRLGVFGEGEDGVTIAEMK